MEVTLDGETLSAAEVEAAPCADRGARPHPRQMGRGRPRAAEPDARPLPGDRAARRRPTGCRSARRCGSLAGAAVADGRSGGTAGELERDGGRPVAGRNAGRPAPSRPAGAGRSRRCAARHAPALPEGGRRVAPSAGAAGARRLPRRRHGARQDHPGPGAAPRPQGGPPEKRSRASLWSCRPRCSPTGRRRSPASRRA